MHGNKYTDSFFFAAGIPFFTSLSHIARTYVPLLAGLSYLTCTICLPCLRLVNKGTPPLTLPYTVYGIRGETAQSVLLEDRNDYKSTFPMHKHSLSTFRSKEYRFASCAKVPFPHLPFPSAVTGSKQVGETVPISVSVIVPLSVYFW